MRKVAATAQIHFDGDIASDHQIPIRVLGQSLLFMQKAIDRAYLDIKYEGVWKNARMKSEDYEFSEFIATVPRKGGYVFDFFSTMKKAPKIIDRVSTAVNEAILQASLKIVNIKDQAQGFKESLANKLVRPLIFRDIISKSNREVKREYGDRSIAKGIDQVVSPIRQDYSGDSNLTLTLTGSSTQKFEFNRASSNKFHQVVARRTLAKPVLYTGKLNVLDKINLRGKFKNSDAGRNAIIHFLNLDDFLKAHPFLGTESEIMFIGSPIIVFGSIEPRSGDIYFLNIVESSGSKDVA